jgi:drug/metabolite transporter (DMT)-like permease
VHEPGKVLRALEISLLALLWSVTYALNKIALATIPPVTLVATRVALAAAVLWVVVFVRGYTIPARQDFVVPLFVQGCITCAIPYTLIAFGQQSVDSALAVILNSTAPVFVCLISLLWTRHEPLTAGRLTGVTMGLAGVVLIAGTSALGGLGQGTVGQAAIIVATFSTAVCAVYGRRFGAVAPEITTAGMLTAATIVLVPLGFLLEAPLNSAPSVASLTALLLNAFGATAFGFVLYFRLIRTIGSMGVASVGYLKPAIGVLIGCTVLGESLTWTMSAGLVAILIGVAAINQTDLLGRLHPVRLQPTSTSDAEKSAQTATHA